MADKIYVYELAKPGDMTALKEVLKSLAYAWLGAGSSAEVSTEGFITMQGRDVSGNLPANEASARRAGEEALKKLLEYAGRLKDAPKALLRSVFLGVRYVSARRPPVDGGGGVWRLLYRPYVRARAGEEALPLADERAYVALEVGSGGRVLSLQVHLHPVVRQRLVEASDVKAPDVLVRLPGSELFRVAYRADWERSIYAPYYISAAAATAFAQGKGLSEAAALLVPAVKESKVLTPAFTDKVVLTVATLKAIAPAATEANIRKHLDALNKVLEAFEINRPLRAAHFLAQVVMESAYLSSTRENFVPDSAYGGYPGRGLIQLTGFKNYEGFTAYMTRQGKHPVTNFVGGNAHYVEQEPYASLSAGWFWKVEKRLNEDADANDFIYVCSGLNGGFNGYDERLKLIRSAFHAFGLSFTDYKFENSGCFDRRRCSFAWGLWHDPGIKSKNNFNTCSDDRTEAVKGYKQFLELQKESDDTPKNWNGIAALSEFTSIKHGDNVLVEDAAKLRLNQLQ